MKKTKTASIYLGIACCWLFALLPFFIPALNTSVRIAGIPYTLIHAFIAVLGGFLIDIFALQKVLPSYDEVDIKKLKEEHGK